MNELGVQMEVRTQIMSPFWLRRVNYGSQYLRLVRLLLSNICIPDKNIGFVGNKRLSLFSMPRGQNEVMWRSKSAGVYPRLVSALPAHSTITSGCKSWAGLCRVPNRLDLSLVYEQAQAPIPLA